ncbi:DUF4861 family protein [Algibacillus agarilyticus]|uniref:DUF4861 family protein n=1 Tax=Algibacillus agarilyticus TaxID=2234133 RepID=UPI001E55CFA6|nr:DUF4861 family protein [Algibacillus agarilyticus]
MNNFKTIVPISLLSIALTSCMVTQDDASKDASAASEATAVTYARHVPERKDDFAWENDLVAFRAYGPAARSGAENSGVDCWLKRVNYPIINLWYKRHSEENISYHKDNGEGLDNYHVGDSAGCGSTSLWLNNKREPLETWTDWKILSQTHDKTVFTLSYDHTVAGDNYKEQKTISIEAGSRLFHVSSTFWKNDKLAINLPVTIGVATHDGKAKPEWNKDGGYLAAWEVLDGSGLGVGVKMQPELIDDVKIIESNGVRDQGHAVFISKTNAKGQIEYYAGYGWEKAGDITTMDKWLNYLNQYKTTF